MHVLNVRAKALKSLDDLPKDYEDPDFSLKEAEKMAVDFLRLQAQEPFSNKPN